MTIEELTMFDPRPGRHRQDDWTTSIAGANDVAYRAGSQKAKLLEAFKDAYPEGLTDEEAAVRAGISLGSEYSKRCGELRQDARIAALEVLGEVVTRAGASGVQRIVSKYVI